MAMPLSKVNNSYLYYPPAQDEIQLISEAVILPLALIIVERNRRELDRKARTLRSIFARAADIMIAKMKADLTTNTQHLLHKSITLCLYTNAADQISYRFNCRGFEDEIAYSHAYIRTEINKCISAYSAEIFTK
jgi:hypothetical protein